MSSTDLPFSSAKCTNRPLMVMDVADGAPDAGDGGHESLDRWTGRAHWQLLSAHKGRIVNRTGQGLMMEFADARSCLQAAFALGRASGPTGHGKRLRLRAGAHLANYSHGQNELIGRDVKLTAGLTALARPGEVLVTADLRDWLADGLDADFEDLGQQRVESSAQPVRLFRAHALPADAADPAALAGHDLRPGLAIIPFAGELLETKHAIVGELIAEGVISRLSHSIGFRVISRRSTSVLRNNAGLAEIERHLGSTFVLSGSYSVRGKKLVVSAELAEARSHTLLWSGQLQYALGDLFEEDSELLHELASTVAQALGKAQVRKALVRPLPSLASSSLMLAGVAMTHSHSAKTYARARHVLTELTARHPQLALPRAWLGLRHALNVVKGASDDAARDTQLAHEQTQQALQASPDCAMALAVEGYIQCQLLGNPGEARTLLNAAIEANPSEPMAWLFKSLASSMWGSTSTSVTEVYFARSLSPVDPMRYFFDMFTGNALCSNRQYEEAIVHARKSLRANKHHAPALRLLMTAQAELGQIEEGKATLALLLAELPGLTLSSYLSIGSTDSPMRQRCAAAMRALGLPER